MTRRNPATRESITIGHGDFRLHLDRGDLGIVTAALAIACNEYAARNTGPNTDAGRRHHAATHLRARIMRAITEGHDK